jgi:hypothetical protein
LRFDQSLDADGLELAWLEVSDSRCPEGAVCVWEGEVGVLLGARRGDQDLGTVALTRRHPGDERAQMRIANRLIQLVEVTPYPVVDQEIGRAEYLAILAVTPVRERRPPDGGLVGSEAPAGGYSGEEPRPEPDGKPDYTSLKAALEKNRQLWEQQGFDAYQFRFQRSCFCLPEMRQPVELIVRDRQIQSARYADGGAAVDAGEFGRYQTVEGLFDLIEAAIAGEAARIEVEFDPQYGYPTRLYVDYYLTMADEERSYEAGGLQPLR